jgi:hypothetical protein
MQNELCAAFLGLTQKSQQTDFHWIYTKFPKPDEPEPNKYYDRCLTEDEESDHGGCGIDGTLCGESARSAVVF